MDIFILIILFLVAVLTSFHLTMGEYYTPYFKKKYKVSMKKYDGINEDVKCWYNEDLKVYMYKEYTATHILYPQGESNGYFNLSWTPIDKTMQEYFNKVDR